MISIQIYDEMDDTMQQSKYHNFDMARTCNKLFIPPPPNKKCNRKICKQIIWSKVALDSYAKLICL